MSGAHPGSIQVAVGEDLRMIRHNIEQNDPEGIAKFTRSLRGTTSVYADDCPEIWAKIMAIPEFNWDKDSWQAFEDEMLRRDLCLAILRKKSLFGYAGEPPMGDSSALLEAMKRSEEEDEVEA
jgi:hypothetical protein